MTDEYTANNNVKSRSDDRYFPRWQVNNRVCIKADDNVEIGSGSTEDLSCTGAKITVDSDLVLDQKIKMTVQLSEKDYVDLCGKIVWVKTDGEKKHVGIDFFNTSEKVQQLILNYAFEVDRKEIVDNWFKGWK